jgi:hypothetical protein
VMSLEKVCEALLRLHKERSKSFVVVSEVQNTVERDPSWSRPCEQLKVSQRRRRNHMVDNSELWQTNHRVSIIGLPFILLSSSLLSFCFIIVVCLLL